MATAVGNIERVDAQTMRLLRLHHPGHGNSIDTAMLVSLLTALEAPLPARALVIEGAGPCFSAGYSLGELQRFDGTAAAAFCRLAHQAVGVIERWPGVTLALVRGPCLGPGLELALACDLIVATPGAQFGLPGLAFGLMPCAGGLRRIAARCPPQVMRDIFLNGSTYRSGQARSAKLVDRVVPAASAPERLVQRWGRWDESSVMAIRSLRLARQGRDEIALEADLFSAGFLSGDIQDRIATL